MQSNEGMANRQGVVDLRFARVSASQLALLAWKAGSVNAHDNRISASSEESRRKSRDPKHQERIAAGYTKE
jgi:hypothetical protein